MADRHDDFEAYVRRHRKRQRPDLDVRLPAEWSERRRRRVQREPPDFEIETAHVLEYARMYACVSDPQIESIKRLEAGRCGYLIRGRCGGAVLLVTARAGRVVRLGSERQFHEMEEVLNG